MEPNNIFTKLGYLFKKLSQWCYHEGYRNNPYWFVTARGTDDVVHEDTFY